jgi:uncharacterized membrane protein YbhN (UPF0104 family)
MSSNGTASPAAKNQSLLKRMAPGLVLGFLVLVALSLFGDLAQVGQLLVRFNWWMFPLALCFTLFNYTLRFLKWHFYLRQIGIRSIPWRRSLRLFVAGFPLAVTPAKAGEVFKAVWLRHFSGITVARGVSVVVAERVSDGLAVLMLSILGVIAYPQYWLAFAVILAILLGAIILSQIRPAALWLLALGECIPGLRRVVHHLREFYEGSFSLFRPTTTLAAVGLGTVSWLGEGIGFYFLLVGLGIPPSTHLLALAIFILAFSTIVGSVTALPGGLGAAEASIAGMLALLAGLGAPQAAAATLLIRLATLWFGVALGLITWTFSGDLIGLQEENGTDA